jgi:hypothetical protein
MTESAHQFEHEKYEELCALSTAGVLTSAESELLTAHLKGCAECRDAFAQYQNIAMDGMPFLADHFVSHTCEDEFDATSALTRLMQATEKTEPRPAPLVVVTSKKHGWNRPWIHGLIAASLVAGAGVGAYWAGVNSANMRLRVANADALSALNQVDAEKQSLEKSIQADNQLIAALKQQATTDKNDLTKLRAEAESSAERIAEITDSMNAAKQGTGAQLAALRQERDSDTAKLRDAEKMYQTVQEELNTLRSQHKQDLVHLASLETRVSSLTSELNDQDKHTKANEQYLASDSDIRDLIGARNLYIADIMDVSEGGQSRKPFGRVFYTKTKSLVFYAYDLDRQPGVKQASTFQVWGRTGTNDRRPINLGILYMDSETNRRWTLRVNNPEQLARLDAVFVTIEPREQTDKPTGKPFLYASLRREPNHP